ncbi:hypothetical protein [Roseateles violae]|uniref:Uncharacterized protein n=1 Tax=Roseateles violae TaxID=3058042 RepID=A0ABT8DQM2_9BURK|nr:hypothetical protein [Pelomonas sp. PFR6]MDN3920650.1 hypothetical protein [Pelomonas sp. PFR6]
MADDKTQPEDPRRQALLRLEGSRARLRAQLLDLPGPGEAASARDGLSHRLQVLWRALRRRLQGSPMASLAMNSVQGWWQRHPLRAGSELLVHELNIGVAPALRRHPVRVLALAAAAGALVIWLRPWRWPLLRSQLRPLPRRLGHWLFAQLSHAPLQTLLTALLASLAGRAAQEPEEQAHPAQAPADRSTGP